MVVPTKPLRERKSAESRRREIMDAAAKVLAERGLAAATVSDITRVAGVAKGTFYLYFESKEHLVAALRERFVQELVEHAKPFIEEIGRLDWWELADAVAEDMVDWTLAHRDICAVIMQTSTPETHDIVVQADRAMIQYFAHGIEAGVRAGAFHVSDPEAAAAFLYNGTIFTVLQASLYSDNVDRDHLVAVAKEINRKVLGV